MSVTPTPTPTPEGALITKSEIIQMAFTRTLSEKHIGDADITVAKVQYVDTYISGYSGQTSFIATYIKPVLAFGIACNIFERLAGEITDRGIVEFVGESARVMASDGKMKLLREYEEMRDRLIDHMITAAEDASVTVVESGDFEPVGFTGIERGRLL
jgi:hypothetical protein